MWAKWNYIEVPWKRILAGTTGSTTPQWLNDKDHFLWGLMAAPLTTERRSGGGNLGSQRGALQTWHTARQLSFEKEARQRSVDVAIAKTERHPVPQGKVNSHNMQSIGLHGHKCSDSAQLSSVSAPCLCDWMKCCIYSINCDEVTGRCRTLFDSRLSLVY